MLFLRLSASKHWHFVYFLRYTEINHKTGTKFSVFTSNLLCYLRDCLKAALEIHLASSAVRESECLVGYGDQTISCSLTSHKNTGTQGEHTTKRDLKQWLQCFQQPEVIHARCRNRQMIKQVLNIPHIKIIYIFSSNFASWAAFYRFT